jgi:hypothetical protein
MATVRNRVQELLWRVYVAYSCLNLQLRTYREEF